MRIPAILAFLIFCAACTRPPATLNHPYGAVAQLNDSTWYGSVQTIPAANLIEKPCAVGKVTLIIRTDIPYPGNPSKTKSERINGCTGECVPTQWLTLFNIPLKKGTYSVDQLNECGTSLSIDGASYAWVVNGSGLKRAFKTQSGKANWVRVTRYDPQTNTLTGRFTANLADFSAGNRSDSSGLTAQFRKGWFVAKLPK